MEFVSNEPPSATSLFDIVFEEVEDESVTLALGIAEDDPWYLRVMGLLKCRVQAELAQARLPPKPLRNTKVKYINTEMYTEYQ